MSFGALSGPAKEALGRGATIAGTSTTTGDGGMTKEERGHSKKLIYQLLPSRYGMNPDTQSELIAVAVFESKEAKDANGNDPNQHKMFQKIMGHLESEPTWVDGEYVSYWTEGHSSF